MISLLHTYPLVSREVAVGGEKAWYDDIYVLCRVSLLCSVWIRSHVASLEGFVSRPFSHTRGRKQRVAGITAAASFWLADLTSCGLHVHTGT